MIFISRRLGGKNASAEPNREIGFGFVSCSCRACVRAKLCGRVVEVFFKAGVQNGNISSGPGLVLGIFVAIGMGFNHFWII